MCTFGRALDGKRPPFLGGEKRENPAEKRRKGGDYALFLS